MRGTPPDGGRYWHSHAYHQDGWGTTTRYTGLGLSRTLVYPEGSSLKAGGHLAVVPGHHLLREFISADMKQHEMEAHLAGRTHPLTGEPLRIRHLELPPGSMISFCPHMPHFVAPRKPGYGVRWGLLLAYREPDPKRRFPCISRGIPDLWVERHLSGETRRLFDQW